MELKQFNLIVAKGDDGKDQMNTSGNMTLNEVADALVQLAYTKGMQDGEAKQDE